MNNTTINQMLEYNMVKFGDRVALIEGNVMLTYRELSRRINCFALRLRDLGVVKNTFIGIMLNNSIEAVISILSVIKAGGAYVPLNPADAEDRKQFILENSGCKLLITSREWEDDICIKGMKIIHQESKDLSTVEVQCKDINAESDFAYLLYTSGSTGKPKGAVISHKNIISQMEGIKTEYRLGEKEVWTQFHTISFDFSVLEIFGCLCSGAALAIVPQEARYSGIKLLHFLEEKKVTVLGLVPSVLYSIPKYKIKDTTLYLNTIILGGEKLSFLKLGIWFQTLPELRIINGYGLTETTVFNMGKTISIEDADSNISNIGHCFYPNEVCILNDDHEICRQGSIGELCIGGSAVSYGYWKNDRLNAEKFIRPIGFMEEKLFFKTGDLVKQMETGEIEYIGRKDHQIKVRGFRVEIEEIENCIRGFQYTKNTAVKTSENNATLICFIELENHEEDLPELKKYVGIKLPDYMRPHKWIVVHEMPLTDRGKIDRNRLSIPLGNRMGISAEYRKGRNDSENEIIQIWEEQFPGIQIGILDSYYELGGNSLMIISMLEEVNSTLECNISMRRFMENPVISHLAKLTEEAAKQKEQIFFEKKELSNDSGFQLTDLQQSFFIGRQSDIELGNCASHSYVELHCNSYKHTQFTKVVQTLVERHDMLRCRVDDMGTQYIENQINITIPLHDLSKKTDIEKKNHLSGLRRRMENQILDYKKAPLARVEVTILKEAQAIVHIYLDALIADGWSHELLLYEADRLYGGEALYPQKLRYSFRDYAAYNEQQKKSEQYLSAKFYWKDEIRKLPGNPQLPMLHHGKFSGQVESEQIKKTMKKEVWGNLQKAANQMRVSVFILMLTAFCKAVAKYSKVQKFVINLPISSRPKIDREINQIVGICSNFFLFDFENIAGETLSKTSSRVQKRMWELKEKEAFHGTEIIREIYKNTGDVGGFVASMVFTSLLDIPIPEKKIFRKTYLETHTSQIWADTVVMKEDDCITLNCDFVKGVLAKELVEKILEDTIFLLKAFTDKADAWDFIKNIPLNKADRQIIQMGRANVISLPGQTLLHNIIKHAASTPDRLAIATTQYQLTYAQMYNKVSCVSQELRLRGVKRGSGIAVVMQKDWYQVISVLAILSVGAYYVPLDTEMPEEKICFCLEEAHAALCLSDNQNSKRVRTISVLNVEQMNFSACEEISPEKNSLEDTFAVIYTSGSTGNPKGIKLKHAGIINAILFTNSKYQVGVKDCAISLTNLCHDMCIYDIFGILSSGGMLVIPDKEAAKNPKRWLELMKKYGVTIWNSVPAFMEIVLLEKNENLKEIFRTLRLVIHGGDFLKVSLAKQIFELNEHIQLINVGGPTETSLWSIYHEVTQKDLKAGIIPYGKAIWNMSHYVLNDNLEIVPVGVTGTIFTSGIGLAIGYVGQDKLYKQRFMSWNNGNGERIFNTGDLGYYMENGEIAIVGRDDHQVKINGKRIELEEIEKSVYSIDGIHMAVVIFNRQKNTLIAYYSGANEIENESLRLVLKEKLPLYMIPSCFVYLSEIPLNRSGKPDRKILKDRTNREFNYTAVSEYTLRDRLDKELQQQTRELLRNKEINIYSNFFIEGGNSITAIQMLAFIKENYFIELGLGDLFARPQISSWHDMILEKILID